MYTLQYQKCATVVYYALYYYTINNTGGDFFECNRIFKTVARNGQFH